LVVFLSHPIRDAKGNYLGSVAGTIYLKQKSILNRLLGAHFYQDGSYLYVVDQDRRLIHHPVTHRIGSTITGNSVIEDVIAGNEGQREVLNSEGTEMLAGYAVIPSTCWGIVAQRPKDATLSKLDALMLNVLLNSLPIAAISLLLILWCARKISRPLTQLATSARTMDDPQTATQIQSVKSWYFEASQLKKAMLLGLGLLHNNISQLRQDVQTDPLTGLGNRRTLENTLQQLAMQKQPFSVISLDIDHFKKVNDTYGHDVGDKVLVMLAALMRECSRDNDVLCRVGGEEFLILLPKASTAVAIQVAERLRQRVASADMGLPHPITISQGVASWPHETNDISAVLKESDQMLYQAKRNGRNRVEAATSSNVLHT
jgi:diguanylate cyclase (GGDEF)-like protein